MIHDLLEEVSRIVKTTVPSSACGDSGFLGAVWDSQIRRSHNPKVVRRFSEIPGLAKSAGSFRDSNSSPGALRPYLASFS